VSLPVVLRAEAIAEFDEAFDGYDSQRAGLGSSFTTKIQAALDAVAANPRLHAVVMGEVGNAVVRRFLLCVY
jgi:hypothetical protein